MTWEPPALHTRNGRLTSYQVRYYEDGAESETEQLFDVLVPEQLKYTARDLKTQTYYHFMVRAFTNSGPGPWTRSNTFQTTGESKQLLLLLKYFIVSLAPLLIGCTSEVMMMGQGSFGLA